MSILIALIFSFSIMTVFSPLFLLFFWGFYAHSLINRLASFSLPTEMTVMYKPNLRFITENAVNPDRRRYAVEGEAEKHYIDLDHYTQGPTDSLPLYWGEALKLFPEDTLRANGIGPWSAYLTFIQLTNAFQEKDHKAIIRLSADLGHYLADLNVPLHSTKNYNGQFTGQEGIHGFWESRIPELQAKDYALWVGKAEYVEKPQQAIWDAVYVAHSQVDSVLEVERELTNSFPKDQKYSFEERNRLTVKVYSKDFSDAYAKALNGQVHRQMKKSIKMIADFWYTAWVNAGQPDLSSLDQMILEDEDINENKKLKVRDH